MIKVRTVDYKCSCHSDLMNSSSNIFHASSNGFRVGYTIHFGNPIKGTITKIIRIEVTELPSYTKASPVFKMRFPYVWGLNASVQSFPFKMIYWAVVSVFKDSSIKFQCYFYKFKEVSRKKSFSRSFQGPKSFSRSIPGPCEPCSRLINN